jgi:S1-C subfamily serine protease
VRPTELPAQVVAFDSRDDLALLRVPGLDRRPLRIASNPAPETAGVILGYPEDGPFDAQPGRIGETQNVLTQDAYGNGPVLRLLTPLRGLVRPGNSGGPMVASDGRVLTTVFAGTTGGGSQGGYGVANATVARLLAGPQAPVGSTACDS